MDQNEFRKRGKEMVDYMCKFMETVASRKVIDTDLKPGYLRQRLPDKAPLSGESWDDIMNDIDSKIVPGILNWQHPDFHAYFPSANSYPACLGDMLITIMGCVDFNWISNPVSTELERVVLDWFGRAIGLPEHFLFSSKKGGGGAIEGSASECVLMCMLSARHHKLKLLRTMYPQSQENFLEKLVGYCSKETHSCVQKAANLLMVKLRILEVDEHNSLRGDTLRKAIEEDEAIGLIPFYVCATIGTTGCCSYDNLEEIADACKPWPDIYLHVDCAYAGSSFICPEFRHLLSGIDKFDSININPNKWMLVNYDCSCYWVKDKRKLMEPLIVNPEYLLEPYDPEFDYRNWQIPLSRRFRSLKLWLVLRNYGINGLQAYIRNHVRLARYFESLIRKDKRFQIMNEVHMGLVCIRLKDSDKLTLALLGKINHSGKMFVIPTLLHGKQVIRFAITYQHQTEKDIDNALALIKEFSAEVEKYPNDLPCRVKGCASTCRMCFIQVVPRSAYDNIMSSVRLPGSSYKHFVPEDEE